MGLDYQALVAARRTLSKHADELRDVVPEDTTARESFNIGFAAAACENAAHAIFQALNASHAYLGDEQAQDAMKDHRAPS